MSLSPLEGYPPSFGNWRTVYDVHERPFYSGSDSTVTDDFPGSTPSPSLNFEDILVDPDECDGLMEYPAAFDHPWPRDHSMDTFDQPHGAHMAGGSRRPVLAVERDERVRHASAMNAPRRRRIQEHNPYPRSPPPHMAVKFAAPHSDQMDLYAESLVSATF
jgi:hypothetical protein